MTNIALVNGCGNEFRKLIKHLNLAELHILKQEKELIDRVEEISEMDADDLREHMVKKWNMTVESCMHDDWWIDITELRKKYPKWARAIVEGHYLPRDTFEQWGRELLMEEVRVNIQIKHIQDLRKIAKEKKEKEQKDIEEQWAELQACGYYGC